MKAQRDVGQTWVNRRGTIRTAARLDEVVAHAFWNGTLTGAASYLETAINHGFTKRLQKPSMWKISPFSF